MRVLLRARVWLSPTDISEIVRATEQAKHISQSPRSSGRLYLISQCKQQLNGHAFERLVVP